jgi:hypothetical protein
MEERGLVDGAGASAVKPSIAVQKLNPQQSDTRKQRTAAAASPWQTTSWRRIDLLKPWMVRRSLPIICPSEWPPSHRGLRFESPSDAEGFFFAALAGFCGAAVGFFFAGSACGGSACDSFFRFAGFAAAGDSSVFDFDALADFSAGAAGGS